MVAASADFMSVACSPRDDNVQLYRLCPAPGHPAERIIKCLIPAHSPPATPGALAEISNHPEGAPVSNR